MKTFPCFVLKITENGLTPLLVQKMSRGKTFRELIQNLFRKFRNNVSTLDAQCQKNLKMIENGHRQRAVKVINWRAMV